MSGLKVLVADDELLARKRLLRLLSAMRDVEIAGECQDGEEVLAKVREGGVDVVLLDIHMPNLNGMDALELMPSDGPYVIFCTAHPDHAVKAFDAGAVDYLLKPIEAARLQKALERAQSRDAQRRFQEELAQHRCGGDPTSKAGESRSATAQSPRPAGGGAEGTVNRLPIPTRHGIVLVDPNVISHASLEGELVTVHTAQGDYLTDFTLQELEEKLPAEKFERVHRRALLNLEHVVRLEPLETGGYTARTAKGHAVEISRQSARALRKRLGLRKAADDEA